MKNFWGGRKRESGWGGLVLKFLEIRIKIKQLRKYAIILHDFFDKPWRNAS